MNQEQRMEAVGMWRVACSCVDVPMMEMWYWPAMIACWTIIGMHVLIKSVRS